MFYWAAVFFVIALVSGIFGFGGLAGSAAGIARFMFYIGVIFLVVSLLTGWRGRRTLP